MTDATDDLSDRKETTSLPDDALMPDERAFKATPHSDLIAEILDSRLAKNEREWAAARDIEKLREHVRALRVIGPHRHRAEGEAMLTPEQRKADATLWAKATLPPWTQAAYSNYCGSSVSGPGLSGCVAERWLPAGGDDMQIRMDMAFIARARAALPEYEAHIQALERRLAEHAERVRVIEIERDQIYSVALRENQKHLNQIDALDEQVRVLREQLAECQRIPPQVMWRGNVDKPPVTVNFAATAPKETT